MFFTKFRKHCLPTKNTVRFLPMQKCCTLYCLTECTYPRKTIGPINEVVYINILL